MQNKQSYAESVRSIWDRAFLLICIIYSYIWPRWKTWFWTTFRQNVYSNSPCNNSRNAIFWATL